MKWVVLLLAAGCAARVPQSHPVVAVAPVAPVIDSALEQLLAERCGVCHDGDEPGRPVFDGKRVLDRRGAAQVALALAAGAMPPPPTQLPDATRRRLVRLACTRQTDGHESPDACVARFGQAEPERWLVGTPAMVRIADREAARTEPGVVADASRRAGMAATLLLTEPDARTIRLDGSFAAMLALVAADRCGDPAVVGEPTYRACVRAVTDYRALALPEPRGAK